MFLAFQVLHFKRFVENSGPIPQELTDNLENIAKDPSAQQFEALECDQSFIDFLLSYDKFTEKTRNGCYTLIWSKSGLISTL